MIEKGIQLFRMKKKKEVNYNGVLEKYVKFNV